MPFNKPLSEKDKEATASANEKTDKADAPITAKTLVKNAHATGNGTTGEHDGEHDPFRDETKDTPPLDGAEQY